MISRHLHAGVLVGLLDDITSRAYSVEDVTPADYPRIRTLCDHYADSDVGFVEGAVRSIVERLDEAKVATLDPRHFGSLRPRYRKSLELLP